MKEIWHMVFIFHQTWWTNLLPPISNLNSPNKGSKTNRCGEHRSFEMANTASLHLLPHIPGILKIPHVYCFSEAIWQPLFLELWTFQMLQQLPKGAISSCLLLKDVERWNTMRWQHVFLGQNWTAQGLQPLINLQLNYPKCARCYEGRT